MTTDIATLGIRVDSSQVTAATKELDHLARAGGISVVGALKGLAGALAALKVYDFAKQVAEAGSQMELFAARIGLISGAGAAAQKQLESLYTVSKRTGTELAATVDVFQRLGQQAGVLGATDREITRVVETIQKLGRISGASGEEMKNAMLQFGQALAAGELRGDELRSILENIPPLAKLIADGLGVSVGQLREMGAAGQLTADRVFRPILAGSDKIDRQFASLPKTLDQSTTEMQNAWTRFLAELDRQTGTSKAFGRIAQQATDTVEQATTYLRTETKQTPSSQYASELERQAKIFEQRGQGDAAQRYRRMLSQINATDEYSQSDELARRRVQVWNESYQSVTRTADKAKNDMQLANQAIAASLGLIVDKGQMATKEQADLAKVTTLVADAMKAGVAPTESMGRALEALRVKADPVASALKAIRDQKMIDSLPEGAERNAAQRILEMNNNRKDQPPIVSGSKIYEDILREERAAVTAAQKTINEARARVLQNEKEIARLQGQGTPGAQRQAIDLEAKNKAIELQLRGIEATVAEAAADQQAAVALSQLSGQQAAATRELNLGVEAHLRLADAAGKGEAAQREAEYATRLATAATQGMISVTQQAAANANEEQAAVLAIRNETVRGLELETQTTDRLTQALGASTAAVRQAQEDEYRLAMIRKLGADATVEGTAAQKALNDAMAAYRTNIIAKDNNAIAQQQQAANDNLAIAQKELEVAGQTEEVRTRTVALFKLEQQIRAQNPQADEKRIKDLLNTQAEIMNVQSATKQTQAAWDELSSIGSRAFDKIGDAISTAFEGGKMTLESFGSLAKSILSDLIRWALQLSVINPLKNWMSGSSSLPTMSSLFGGQGSGSSGGLSDLFGGNSSGGGMSGWIDRFGYNNLGIGTEVMPSDIGSLAAWSPEANYGISYAGGLSSYLPGIGMGLGGMFQMAQGNYMGGAAGLLGGGISAFGGALGLGAAAGPIGMGIGLVGSMLGGLFGDSGYRGEPIGAADIGARNGRFQLVSSGGDNNYDASQVVGQANQLISKLNSFADKYGLSIDTNTRYSVASYNGDEGNSIYRTSPDALLSEMLSRGIFSGGSGNVSAVARNYRGTSIEDFGASLDFAQYVDGFAEKLRSLQDPLQSSIDALTRQRDAEIARAQSLGLEYSAMQQYYDLSLKRAREDRELAFTVSDLGLKAREAVLAGDEAAARLAEFDAKAARERISAARDGITDIVRLEKVLAGERSAIVRETAGYSQGASISATQSLKGLISNLSFGQESTATAEQRFFYGLTEFNTSMRRATETRGDRDISDFVSSAQSFLPMAREFLGTTKRYDEIVRSAIQAALTIGGDAADPAGIGRAVTNGAKATVEAIDELIAEVRSLRDQNQQLNSKLEAIARRAAG